MLSAVKILLQFSLFCALSLRVQLSNSIYSDTIYKEYRFDSSDRWNVSRIGSDEPSKIRQRVNAWSQNPPNQKNLQLVLENDVLILYNVCENIFSAAWSTSTHRKGTAPFCRHTQKRRFSILISSASDTLSFQNSAETAAEETRLARVRWCFVFCTECRGTPPPPSLIPDFLSSSLRPSITSSPTFPLPSCTHLHHLRIRDLLPPYPSSPLV